MNANQKAEFALLALPGDTIQETIDYLNISQTEMASRMGITPAKLNDIIKAKEPITIATAFKLEKVLNIQASFWMNRQNAYNEKKFRIEQYQYLDSCLLWLKQIPVAFLKKANYINAQAKGVALVEQVLQFFRVASPTEWQNIYVLKYANTNFKKSTVHAGTLGSMATWIRIGELEMEKRNTMPYDKKIFVEVLEAIKNLVPSKPDYFIPKIVSLCATAGVAVIYTPKIPKSPVSGATRWIGGNPIIQLTDRHCSNDQFWFSFFHEVAHILLHGKSEIFIEDFEGMVYDAKKEAEANNYAAKILLKENVTSILHGNYSELHIKKVAKLYNTHVAIIVGRLQREGVIGYNRLNGLKEKVKLF
jgi:HTH-type transcriptional regulator / antitoxin HigA